MKNKRILSIVATICILSLISMTLALTFGEKRDNKNEFQPPPFESAAQVGLPTVDESLGWSEIYQDGMEFKAYVCGYIFTDGDNADVYFANSKQYNIWLKLRILDEKGSILGETGLLKPGEYVKSVSLTSDVEDGEKIKLKIMAYEPDTYYSAGTVILNTIIRKGDVE